MAHLLTIVEQARVIRMPPVLLWGSLPAILLIGCGKHSPPAQPEASSRQQVAAGAAPVQAAAKHTGGPRRLSDPDGIHNLLKASPRIYSGSEPDGDAGFASLARLGIRTVVSVDGAKPDLEAAGRHRLRYVHIPIGYDGLPRKASEMLARLVRDVEGPIYVHCHHGQHRGPAAAAVACLADGTSKKQATQILEMAGTAKSYPGLWRDVAGYTPPPLNATLPDLVETAQVESFAAAMAKIDRNFDNLKLCQQAGWTAPPDHPDVVAAQESLILKEGLRESLRNLVADRPPEFQQWLRQSADFSESLEQALQWGDDRQATELLQALEQSCKQCHAKYRNR